MAKNEIKFCEENEFVRNEHGQFIYENKGSNVHAMNIPYMLLCYKDWLIENNIVKEP